MTVVVPSAATRTEPRPLLVLLHGLGENPSRWIGLGTAPRAELLAEAQGIILALPPASGRWDVDGGGSAGNADVRYVAGLATWLTAHYPVDPARVYVGGFSMGGVMAGRVACERADTFAGLVMLSGGDWGGTCAPTAPVTIVAMHGMSDTTLPYANAVGFVDRWRTLDGCSASPFETTLSTAATARTSDACTAGTAVVFVRVAGGTHRYFTDPDALTMAWDVLTTHQRASDPPTPT